MAPIPTLLLLVTVIQLCNQAFSDYIRPYNADVLTQFPPLLFPGQNSTWDTSILEQKLSQVERQIEAMENAKKATTVGTVGIGFIPGAAGILESATGLLADHFMSAADLEDLRLDLKIEIGIDKAFVNHSLSHLRAEMTAIKNRLSLIFGGEHIKTKTREGSVDPALHACEKILELFRDETHVFWKYKLVFYPHLMSFAGVFAPLAAAADELDSDKRDLLEKNMKKLRETILKYYPVVKAKRLSKLYTYFRDEPDNLYFINHSYKALNQHVRDVVTHCPNFRFFNGHPPSPFTSCIRGRSEARIVAGSSANWHQNSDYILKFTTNYRPFPEVFKDSVTGETFCGWKGCWENLNEFYGNEMDDLTKLALEAIPFDKQPYELAPATTRDYAQCQLDSYGRILYRGVRPMSLDSFGCHNGYCWSECAFKWCYTRNRQREEYVRCEIKEDCCPEWECQGFCHFV